MESEQEKPLFTAEQIVAILRRRRWWIILPVVVAWGLATTAGWMAPPKYRSETTILIEQQKVPEQYVVPNVSVDMQQRLQSLSQQILSRTRLLGIIEKFQLYGKQRGHADPDSLVDRMRSQIDIELVRGQRPDELSGFKITYSAPDPVLAQQVTGELTSLFINENLRSREELSTETTKFLQMQLEEAQKSLNAQEQRLAEFKSKNLGELPEQLQSNLQILSGMQSRLQAANDALNAAQQQREYLQSLLTQYKTMTASTTADTQNGPVNLPALEQHLTQLRSELAQMTARYTPQHPDVIRLKTEIAGAEKLKGQIEAEMASAQKKGSSTASPETAVRAAGSTQAMSPVVQIESQLEANKLEIANRKQEMKRLETGIEDYQHRLNMTPIREEEFASIIRDHDQSQKNYESLLAKKLQSEMASDLERRQQGETFRVLDPPNLPQRPYSPKRMTFCLGGIGVGLALGLALALVLEFLNPRVHCEADLRQPGSVPFLVAIPRLATVAERSQQRRRLVFEGLTMAAMLAVISAGSLFTYWKG